MTFGQTPASCPSTPLPPQNCSFIPNSRSVLFQCGFAAVFLTCSHILIHFTKGWYEMKNNNVIIRIESVVPPLCALKVLSANLCCCCVKQFRKKRSWHAIVVILPCVSRRFLLGENTDLEQNWKHIYHHSLLSKKHAVPHEPTSSNHKHDAR